MTRKILTLLLTLSLLIGMALPAAAEGEAVETPIIPNGGFEELEEDGQTATGWGENSKGIVIAACEGSSPHTGNGYLRLQFGNAQRSPKLTLAPETQYMLEFWARTTVEDGSYIQIRFLKDDSGYTYINEGKGDNNEGGFLEYFGIANEAPKTDEGEMVDVLPWQKFSFAFTTPKHTIGATIDFWASARGGINENWFCLDDVSLTATGREPNLLRNGYLTAFKVDGKLPSGWADRTAAPTAGAPNHKVEYIKNAETGEVVANFTEFIDSGAMTWQYYVENVYLSPGNYKLSFEYENGNNTILDADRVPYVTFTATGTTTKDKVVNVLSVQETNIYEAYFTITTAGAYVFTLYPAKTDVEIYTKLANMRIWKDEASVQYGKAPAKAGIEVKNNLAYDVIIPVSKISDAGFNADSTAYVVQPKGHYIPETDGTEKFMMVNALYRKYEDGRRIFESVTFANGEASGGMVSNVNDSIEVPVLTGEEDYTYEIQSYLWAGANGMEPVADKTVLTY